jgi:hypothetical protein
MNSETQVQNPLEGSQGLTDKQEAEARKLLRRESRLKERLLLNSPEGKEDKLIKALGGYLVGDAIYHVARHQLEHTEKSRTAHYRKNEVAYQEQAVKDAAREGVHTDFGIEQAGIETQKSFGRTLKEIDNLPESKVSNN